MVFGKTHDANTKLLNLSDFAKYIFLTHIKKLARIYGKQD